MTRRLNTNKEKKESASFSVEPTIKFDFYFACSQSNSNASRELRGFMLDYIKKYNLKNVKK
jgi:hypothetical protein